MARSLKEIIQLRSTTYQILREFFWHKGFYEVETPILVRSPGVELHLQPFQTTFYLESSETTLYLHTSPEFCMKKLLARSLDNIFQICKVFRNNEIGQLHQPEFTLLEWYETGVDYYATMHRLQELVNDLAEKLYQKHLIPQPPDFSTPWLQMTVNEAFIQHLQFSILDYLDYSSLFQIASQRHLLKTEALQTWEELFSYLLCEYIEPYLGQKGPTLLYEYPAELCSLSKLSAENPKVCERFELYIKGVEIANAYTELLEAEELRKRQENDLQKRRQMNLPIIPIDEELLRAMKSGLAPCSGIAVGLDRLIMLLFKAQDIREVLLFPFE